MAYKLRNQGGLRDLSLHFPPSSRPSSWPRKFLSSFPTLRSLTVSLRGHSKATYFPMMMSSEDVEALPRSLIALALLFELSLSDGSVAHFPASLQTLIIPACTTLTGASLPNFPRGLVRLELPKAHKIGDTGLLFLPPNLALLDLSSAAITDSGLAKLPKSLIHLNLQKNEKLTAKSLSKLPSLLVDLSLIRPLKNLTDEDVKHLPKYLATLDLGYNNLLTDAGFALLPLTLETLVSNWNENVTANVVQFLPKTLRNLHMGWPKFSDAVFLDLPASLHTLQIDSNNVTNSCLQFLPPTLTSLTLSTATEITDAGISKISVPLKKLALPNSPLTPACLASVPRSVMILQLRLPLWDDLREADLKNLPPHLASLEADSNYHLTEKCFASLPPCLQSFCAAKLVLHDPKRLAELPKNITRLRMAGDRHLSSEVWEYVPKHIQYFYLPGPVFHLNDVQLLPSAIKELTIAIASDFDAQTGEYSEIHPKHWGQLPSQLEFIRCSPVSSFRLNHHRDWVNVDATIVGRRR